MAFWVTVSKSYLECSHTLHVPTASDVQGILIVNGTAAPEWTYVLDVQGPSALVEGEWEEWTQAYKLPEITDIASENITCGRAAFLAAPRTKTADVLAGSEVGFRVSSDGNGVRDGVFSSAGGNKYPSFWHPGPAQIYLSRAPNDDLQNYKGDGDWFKIAYAGPLDDTHWSLWPYVSDVCGYGLEDSMLYTILD